MIFSLTLNVTLNLGLVEFNKCKVNLMTEVSFMKSKILLLAMICFLISCSGSEPASSTGGGGTGGGTGSGSSTSANLSLEVKRNFEGGTSKTSIVSCEIPTTATLGTTLACNVQVEELILHFSDLDFIYSTNSSSTCTRVVFRPYYYLKSTSAAFLLDGADATTDCTVADANCYGGAAPGMPDLISGGFPKIGGLYYLTRNQLSASTKLDAASIRVKSNADRDLRNNTAVTNNLPLASRGANINTASARYLANTYNDYTLSCYNDFGELNYEITLTIGDDDIAGTPVGLDSFYDWGL